MTAKTAKPSTGIVNVGLGDWLHNFFERLGIAAIVRRFSKNKTACESCSRRQSRLNVLFPFPPPRGRPFLTIGMPHRDDWEGVWSTIQSVLGEANSAGILDRVQILVVDQSSDSGHGAKVRDYLKYVPNTKYVAMQPLGSALSKDKVFREADGEWVCCVDCHATFEPGSLAKTFRWLAKYRFDPNIFGGVMVNSLAGDGSYSSHLDRKWQGDSLGVWQKDKRAASAKSKPFEVENLAGWFLFARKDSWLRVSPYHPLMREFGGEEGVMSLAFHRAGRKCFVLPCARAAHRYGRGDGVRFRISSYDRIRNYAIAFHAMGATDELVRMAAYFCFERPDATQRATMAPPPNDIIALTVEKFREITGGAANELAQWNAQQLVNRREQLFAMTMRYFPDAALLREEASQAESVFSFSSRHEIATAALLAGQPKKLTAVDALASSCGFQHFQQIRGATELELLKADALGIDLPAVDLLVIDLQHEDAKKIFERHADSVAKCIAFIGADDRPEWLTSEWKPDEWQPREWRGESLLLLDRVAGEVRQQSPAAEVFCEIHRRFSWGAGETISGPGSTLEATRVLRADLLELFAELGVTSLLDLPCGDHHWMAELLKSLPGLDYIGADIVPAIIDTNREQYPRTKFETLDLLTDELPQCDAVLVRDALVHLPNADVVRAIDNIKASGATWLFATTFPGRKNNDIPMGHWRPMDLTAEPFNLPQPSYVINEECREGNGAFADKSIGVWKIADLVKASDKRCAKCDKVTGSCQRTCEVVA